jgi:hypothetical protein
MSLSYKKKLEISVVCYANVSGSFAHFSNQKNRVKDFTLDWDGWIRHCVDEADLWMTIHLVRGNKKLINETAREFTREIAETLVERYECEN